MTRSHVVCEDNVGSFLRGHRLQLGGSGDGQVAEQPAPPAPGVAQEGARPEAQELAPAHELGRRHR